MERGSRLEPQYPWWNRSAMPEVASARDILEGWFGNYPRIHRAALARRFRSVNDQLHRGALFELFIHEHLIRAGFRVRCHPGQRSGSKSPDFLASNSLGGSVFVEAACSGQSASEVAADRLKDEAIELIDSLKSNDFWVSVFATGKAEGSLPLRGARLRERVTKWLDGLKERGNVSSGLGQPRSDVLKWSGRGLTLELRATPKTGNARNVDRLLGSESGMAWFVPPGHAMLEGTLRKKAGRYGVLKRPYVVSVNVLDAGVREGNIAEALEAVWGTIGNAKYTRVSGVLLATISCVPGAPRVRGIRAAQWSVGMVTPLSNESARRHRKPGSQ